MPPRASAASGDPEGVRPGYPTANSMSALAAFPWVWVCVRAVSTDLAGLPLVAKQSNGDGTRKTIHNHPTLDLLNNPSEQCSGMRLRRQLLVDFLLTGNAYLWTPAEAAVPVILRLHPKHVVPKFDRSTGQISHYRYNDQQDIPWREVLHMADISWSDDIQGLLGESAIRCLHDDLTMEKSAKALAAKSSKRGRPEILFSPKDSNVDLGKDAIGKLRAIYDHAMSEGHGAFFVSGAIEATPLSLSPRDMEFAARSTATRDAVLAVFECPPSRVGLPLANYGTAKAQARVYWENLIHKAKLFDDEFSRLTGDGTRIEHDFTNVEALQVSYTERQMRAATWITAFGADPAAAAAFEGFDEAPVGNVALEDLRAPRRPAVEVDEPQKSLDIALSSYFSGAVQRFASHVGDISHLSMRESGYLSGVLEHAGVDRGVAFAWAQEIAQSTCDAVEMNRGRAAVDGVEVTLSSLAAFSERRASNLARRIRLAGTEQRANHV